MCYVVSFCARTNASFQYPSIPPFATRIYAQMFTKRLCCKEAPPTTSPMSSLLRLRHNICIYISHFSNKKPSFFTPRHLQSVIESKHTVVHVVLPRPVADELKHFTKMERIVTTNLNRSRDENQNGIALTRRLNVGR